MMDSEMARSVIIIGGAYLIGLTFYIIACGITDARYRKFRASIDVPEHGCHPHCKPV